MVGASVPLVKGIDVSNPLKETPLIEEKLLHMCKFRMKKIDLAISDTT